MRVQVLALDSAFDLGLAGILDVMQTANELIEVERLGIPPFEVTLIGVQPTITTAQGFTIPVSTADDAATDCVVVPAIGFRAPQTLEPALGRADVLDAVDLLRSRRQTPATITAACVGTFILAESGLLDGEDATTTWWLGDFFRKRYPRVRLDASRMLVRSGRAVTCGAALAHVDLALWIVRTASPALATLTARYLILDNRPSQAAYALADHQTHADPVVDRFEQWIRANMKTGFSLDGAARHAGASKRTLARHVERALGLSPLEYFQKVRVEKAVHLLRAGHTADEVAGRLGYGSGAALRLLLRKQLGIGLRDIRGA